MNIQAEYKKKTGRPIYSTHGKHPKIHYMNYLEEQLSAERERAKELEKYAEHDWSCHITDGKGNVIISSPCTCGLNKIIKQPSTSNPE